MVELDDSKRALTSGQYAVFYREDECLGSAKISHSGASEFSLEYSVLKGCSHLQDFDKNKVAQFGL